VIPVAILGSDTFDVLDIDTSLLFFAGLEVRIRGKKGPLCHGEFSNGDGFLDLVCQFEDDPSMWAVDSSAEATLTCVWRIPILSHKSVQNPSLVMLVLIVTIVA